MTREEHLAYCKVCTKRKTDFKVGLVCSLTDKVADFENSCENFQLDPQRREENKKTNKEATKEDFKKDVNWFLWLTILNLLGGLIYFARESTPNDTEQQIINIIYLIIRVGISGIFAIIWHFSKRENEIAYLIGMILYGIDTIITAVAGQWIALIPHAYVLFRLIRGFGVLNKLKEAETIKTRQ